MTPNGSHQRPGSQVSIAGICTSTKVDEMGQGTIGQMPSFGYATLKMLRRHQDIGLL